MQHLMDIVCSMTIVVLGLVLGAGSVDSNQWIGVGLGCFGVGGGPGADSHVFI